MPVKEGEEQVTIIVTSDVLKTVSINKLRYSDLSSEARHCVAWSYMGGVNILTSFVVYT